MGTVFSKLHKHACKAVPHALRANLGMHSVACSVASCDVDQSCQWGAGRKGGLVLAPHPPPQLEVIVGEVCIVAGHQQVVAVPECARLWERLRLEYICSS